MTRSELGEVLVAQRVLVEERGEAEDRVMLLLGYEPRIDEGNDRLDDEHAPDNLSDDQPPTDPDKMGQTAWRRPFPSGSHRRSSFWLRGLRRLRKQRRWLLALVAIAVTVAGIVGAVRVFGWVDVLAFLLAMLFLAIIVPSMWWLFSRKDTAHGIDGGRVRTGEGDGLADYEQFGNRGEAREFRPMAGRPRPNPNPIVDFGSRRGIAAALLSVRGSSGVPDLARLVEMLAQGRPVTQVPTRVGYSLQSGFTVLIDRGSMMTPFLSDLRSLQASLQNQFPGADRRFLTFADHPYFGVGSTLLHLEPLTPSELPHPPGRVLVISDLGIGSGLPQPTVNRWVSFDRLLVSLGVSPLYLIPYESERLPEVLRCLPVLEWRPDLHARLIRRRGQRS